MPVPGDPEHTIQMFDVRDLVEGDAATPEQEPDAPSEKREDIPLLAEIPILDFLFRGKGKDPRPGARRSRDVSAKKVRLETLVTQIQAFIEPKLDKGEEVKSMGKGLIVALASAEKLAWISRFLAQARKHPARAVQVHCRFIVMPPAVYDRIIKPRIEKSGLAVTPAPNDATPSDHNGPRERRGPEVARTYAMLPDADTMADLLVSLTKEKGVEIIQAPKMVTLPLTSSSLFVGNSTSYVKDFEIEVAKDGSVVVDPVIDVIRDGFAFGCVASITENEAVGMDFSFTLADLKRPIPNFTTRLGDNGPPMTIQLPELTTIRLESRVELTRDQTAVFALLRAPKSDRHLVVLLRARLVDKGK